MAGVYIHIPFCKQACSYCNFHFSTSLDRIDAMIHAIVEEIVLRKDFFGSKYIDTIYFGGGTPSLLSSSQMTKLVDCLKDKFEWDSIVEVTLEANPDDISDEKLAIWKNLGIQRLSIGVQSFFEEDLKFMHRVHTAQESCQAIEKALEYGFEDLSIDLIYGSPTTSMDRWRKNIDKVLEFSPNHISAYALTVEPRTALAYQVMKQPTMVPDQDIASRQLDYLVERLERSGYDHYEISNFAKHSKYALHNTNYWLGKPYLGIGPSAHSFDGSIRSWNISNNNKYIATIQSGNLSSEQEVLSKYDKYNEYIMTGLRTKWGVDIGRIEAMDAELKIYFQENAKSFLHEGTMLCYDNKSYLLSARGKHFADRIASDLFWVEP